MKRDCGVKELKQERDDSRYDRAMRILEKSLIALRILALIALFVLAIWSAV